MFRKTGLLICIIFLVLGVCTIYIVWKSSIPLISPIALIESLTGNSPISKSPKIIYGFFPYWNTKYSEQINVRHLTHFAYFAIDLNPDGTINKQNSSRELEPGWNKLHSDPIKKIFYQVKLLGQKTVLTVTAMTPDLIESIINHPDNANTTIDSILKVYNDFRFDDINIDFEYIGNPDPQTRRNFTEFISALHTACTNTKPLCAIDVDIFGDTANKNRLWDLGSLNQFVSRFIVMTYDYYRKNSTQAGPVAPLTGQCIDLINTKDCVEHDIVSNISAITKIIPPEKIILGIPFYGYQWQTASEDFLANTYPRTGSLATYARIQTIFSDPEISSISAKWSEATLSPYLVFSQNNNIYQVHFENTQSLDQKIKLVQSANLGGVAIWAIGYETPFDDIWQPIFRLTTH